MKPGLESWAQPWHRDTGREDLAKGLRVEIGTAVRGEEAVLRCIGAAIHALALMSGLFLLSPVLAGASFLLAIPMVITAKMRRRWLDASALGLRRGEGRFQNMIGIFLDGLDSARGNRRIDSSWKVLDASHRVLAEAEWKWLRAQMLLPALLEWFYFALLAALLFWMGPRFGGLAQPAGALTLLLLLYQPIREFGRHWTSLRLGSQSAQALRDLGRRQSVEMARGSLGKQPETLVIRNLTFRYPEGPALFSGWAGAIQTQGWTCLRGPNGAGKSTLLRLLAGVETPVTGTILWPKTWGKSGGAVGYLPQPAVFEPDFLPWLREFFGLGNGNWMRWRDWLGLHFVEARLHGLPSSAPIADPDFLTGLSGGEKQRLALLRVLAGGRDFVLLDEPGTGLPEAECEAIFSQVIHRESTVADLDLPRGGIIASHHPWFAKICAPQILEL